MNQLKCNHCNTNNNVADNYCYKCGARLTSISKSILPFENEAFETSEKESNVNTTNNRREIHKDNLKTMTFEESWSSIKLIFICFTSFMILMIKGRNAVEGDSYQVASLVLFIFSLGIIYVRYFYKEPEPEDEDLSRSNRLNDILMSIKDKGSLYLITKDSQEKNMKSVKIPLSMLSILVTFIHYRT